MSTTVSMRRALREIGAADPAKLTTGEQNALVRRHLEPGPGVFIEELRRELTRRRIDVPFVAHDMMAELAAG